MVANIERFESLGHNCEFGFYQRLRGIHISSFFRWVYAPLPSLCSIIENDFDRFFEPDEMKATTYTAAADRYGLGYHTAALSTKGVFNDPEDKVRAILIEEREKHLHLLTKFRQSMADPDRVFVCQQKNGVMVGDLRRFKRIFPDRFRGQLLFVGTPDHTAQPVGSLESLGDRMHMATIETLYPLDPKRDNSAAWDAVLTTFEQRELAGQLEPAA